MGSFIPMTTAQTNEKWKRLDEDVARGDEDRWLSSRYAAIEARKRLIALYAFNLELARIRLAVTEPGLGAIRFEWWREAVAELEKGKDPRRHDAIEAVAETAIAVKTLLGLVDGHQAAFDTGDAELEPEVLLMRAAAGQLTLAHGWGPHIADLAPAYARARRGVSEVTGPVLPKVPAPIRPAICHAVLRFDYATGRRPGPLAKRITLVRAMLQGRA
ncbi:MAG: squalene/phytoene synthase family protein [Pseudomonadota bacterium]